MSHGGLDAAKMLQPNGKGKGKEGIQDETAASTNLAQLISDKGRINDLLEQNKSYIASLQACLAAAQEAEQDLDSMKRFLDMANEVAIKDAAIEKTPVYAEHVRLPLYPAIYDLVPLLSSQSNDVEDLRSMLSTFPWSKEEAIALKKAVLAQCLRVATLQMATGRQCPDDLFEVMEQKSDMELSRVSRPVEGEDETIDWTEISISIGATHTPEDCRTRWLMVDRCDLSQEDWTDAEICSLQRIIESGLKSSPDGVIRDWEGVARELKTERTGIACFSMCKREGMLPSRGVGPAGEEEQDSQAAAANDDDHLAAPQKKRRGKYAIRWSAKADEALIAHVAKNRGATIKRQRTHADIVGPIDFSKGYRGRPKNATDQDVEQRWSLLSSLQNQP